MSTGASPRLAALRAVRDVTGHAGGGVAIEYGLIAALIVVALLGVLSDLGEAVLGLPLSALIDTFASALS